MAGRKPLSGVAMTPAQRKAREREARQFACDTVISRLRDVLETEALSDRAREELEGALEWAYVVQFGRQAVEHRPGAWAAVEVAYGPMDQLDRLAEQEAQQKEAE